MKELTQQSTTHFNYIAIYPHESRLMRNLNDQRVKKKSNGANKKEVWKIMVNISTIQVIEACMSVYSV